MKKKQYLFIVIGLLVLCPLLLASSCEDGGEEVEMIEDPSLNCEENWDRMEGPNGRLTQTVRITFTVPDEYAGPEPPDNPYLVGFALTPNPEVPVMDPPKAMGYSDKEALLIPGETYTYVTTFVDRASSTEFEICGEYFYITVGIYYYQPSFPVAGEWAFMSEAMYQMGGDDDIVIENALMQDNRLD
jgi:hypothetical protein